MNISSKQLAKALYQMIAEEPKHERKIVNEFIKYLEEKNLLGIMSGVVKHLETYQAAELATTQVKLRVAHEPAKALITEIKKHINAPDAEVVTTIDESLVGGFQAEYQYKIYDGSVSYQLQQAKKVLLGNKK